MGTISEWGQIVWKDTTEVSYALAYCGPETGLARYPGYYGRRNLKPVGETPLKFF